ncbi:MAG: fused MFS/spermidine synthase [Pseudomonadales bacterium]
MRSKLMRYPIIIIVVVCFLPGAAISPASFGKTIHQEKSLYRNIVVSETGSRRCLVFAVKRGDRNQTCLDLDDPKRLVFPYVRMTMGGLLINPDPHRILIIGLGGGTMPTALSELYSNATIDIVEIDEAVVRVAEKFFGFKATERMQVHVRDARVFVKRAILNQHRYDFVILDAFTGDYIPEHLLTVEFLQEVKSIMDPDGVLVANTFSTSVLYDHESETYQAVYGDFLNFKMPITGNRVIIAKLDGLPTDAVIRQRAELLAPALAPYDVELEKFPGHMSRGQDWDHHKRPLTDQYSPANLLRGDLY